MLEESHPEAWVCSISQAMRSGERLYMTVIAGAFPFFVFQGYLMNSFVLQPDVVESTMIKVVDGYM